MTVRGEVHNAEALGRMLQQGRLSRGMSLRRIADIFHKGGDQASRYYAAGVDTASSISSRQQHVKDMRGRP